MIKPLQLALDFFGELTRPIASTSARRHADPTGAAPVPARPACVYELRRGPRRRSLSIEVHPDLRVVVRAPLRYPQADIEDFVAARARWIAAQIEYFRQQPRTPIKPGFADGDSHLYLGQTLRLVLDPQTPRRVVQHDHCLVIGGSSANDPHSVRRALDHWYRARAEQEFNAILARCHQHPRFARYLCPPLQIRSMRTRWGSLGARRGMTLNLVLIQAPRACIEFVVMHELCHLRYHGHGKGFYRLLDSVLPDWRARKAALEETLR